MPFAAAAGAVAAAGIGAYSASQASGAASRSAKSAQAQDLAMFQYNANRSQPFVNAGTQAAQSLQANQDYFGNYSSPALAQAAGDMPGLPNMPDPNASQLYTANLMGNAGLPDQPNQMTQAELEQTPGYQFNLSQGLKSTQAAAAARGLGVSGAALKGAAQYATGLADNTYKTQFDIAQQRYQDVYQGKQQAFSNYNNAQQATLNNWNQAHQQVYNNAYNLGQTNFNDQSQIFNNRMALGVNQQNQVQGNYNRLAGIANIGANSAAGIAQQGTQASGQMQQANLAGGAANAAGIYGVGNALSGGINAGVNALGSYGYLSTPQGQPMPQGGYAMAGFNNMFGVGQQSAGGIYGGNQPIGY